MNKSLEVSELSSTEDSLCTNSTPENNVKAYDDDMTLSNRIGKKKKKLKNQFRNFWNQHIHPRLTSNPRALFYLKIINYRFSGELFRSLPFLIRELNLSLRSLVEFHEAILQVFASALVLQQRFPRYYKKFLGWCSEEQRSILYQGRNAEQWRSDIQKLISQTKPIDKVIDYEEDIIHKKIRFDPDVKSYFEDLRIRLDEQERLIQEILVRIGGEQHSV
jgi:hypothetical protein